MPLTEEQLNEILNKFMRLITNHIDERFAETNKCYDRVSDKLSKIARHLKMDMDEFIKR
jgi:response regulator RpfG family c-di-GMP phosphodiesterase